jgi:hypothetical protein
MQSYLRSHFLLIDAVVRLANAGLRIAATPTLLLANRSGVVAQVWQGKLQPQTEAEVIAAMTKLVGG